MNVPLPLPNPQDWVGMSYVTDKCGVGKQTVYRWAGRGAAGYRPPLIRMYQAEGHSAPMFWRAEIEQFALARALTKASAR